MNVVACVKQVVDPQRISGFDWEAGVVLATERAYMTNPYDECAIEEAVRLVERTGSGQVVLVSVGPPRVEAALHRGLALGADGAIRVWDDGLDGVSSNMISTVLAKAIDSLEYGLILCGERAVDEGSAQVGAIVAELLGLPYVSAITKLEVESEERCAIVHRRAKGRVETIRTSLPAVFSVSTVINEPRYVSVLRYRRVSKEPVSEISPYALGLVVEDLSRTPSVMMEGLSSPRPMPQPISSPESSLPAAARIGLILSAGIPENGNAQTHVLDSSVEHSVSKVLEFLSEQRVV